MTPAKPNLTRVVLSVTDSSNSGAAECSTAVSDGQALGAAGPSNPGTSDRGSGGDAKDSAATLLGLSPAAAEALGAWMVAERQHLEAEIARMPDSGCKVPDIFRSQAAATTAASGDSGSVVVLEEEEDGGQQVEQGQQAPAADDDDDDDVCIVD